jgi:hypothetical protein
MVPPVAIPGAPALPGAQLSATGAPGAVAASGSPEVVPHAATPTAAAATSPANDDSAMPRACLAEPIMQRCHHCFRDPSNVDDPEEADIGHFASEL